MQAGCCRVQLIPKTIALIPGILRKCQPALFEKMSLLLASAERGEVFSARCDALVADVWLYGCAITDYLNSEADGNLRTE